MTCFLKNTAPKSFLVINPETLFSQTPAPQSPAPFANSRLNNMNNCFRLDGDKIRLEIKAVPGASNTELAGVKDGRLRVRIAAAPEDGKANAQMLNFLSKALGCPKRDLQLLSGEKSRLKTITFPLELKERLERILI